MREEPVVTRRATLRRGALAAGALAGVAGCLETGVGDEPDPLVVRTEPADLSDVTENRTIEVSVLVHNVGAGGEVLVTVETLAGAGQDAIETASTTLSMDSDTQTEVTLTIDASAVADRIEATAEPAE
jgi:hypothetical protein